MTVEQTRAQLEAGWPEALTVSPEALAELRAYDRGMKLKMWAAAFAVPLFFMALVVITSSLLRRPVTQSPVYEPPRRSSPPAATARPPLKRAPALFQVDRDLVLQLTPLTP